MTDDDLSVPKCCCSWSNCRNWQRQLHENDHPCWNGVVTIAWDDDKRNDLKSAWDTILQVKESKRRRMSYTVAQHHFSQALLLKMKKSGEAWDWTDLLNKNQAQKYNFSVNKAYSKKVDEKIRYWKLPDVSKDFVSGVVEDFVSNEKQKDDGMLPRDIARNGLLKKKASASSGIDGGAEEQSVIRKDSGRSIAAMANYKMSPGRASPAGSRRAVGKGSARSLSPYRSNSNQATNKKLLDRVKFGIGTDGGDVSSSVKDISPASSRRKVPLEVDNGNEHEKNKSPTGDPQKIDSSAPAETEDQDEIYAGPLGSPKKFKRRLGGSSGAAGRTSRVSVVADSMKFMFDEDYRQVINERVGHLEIQKQQGQTLKLFQQKISSLQKDIKQYRENEAEKDDIIVDLEYELQNAAAHVQKEVNKAVKEVRIEMEDAKNKLKAIIRQLKKRIAELEAQDWGKERETLIETEKDRIIQDLEKQLLQNSQGRTLDFKLQKELEEERQKSAAEIAELTNFEKEQLKLQEQNQESLAQLQQELDDERVQSVAKVAELHKSLEETRRQNELLNKEKTELDKTNADIKNRLAQTKEEQLPVEAELRKEYETGREKSAAESAKLRRENEISLSQLETKVRNEMEERHAKSNAQVAALEKSLDEMHLDNQKLENEKSNMDKRLQGVQEKLGQRREESSEVEAGLRKELESERIKSGNAITEIRKYVEELKQQSEEATYQLQHAGEATNEKLKEEMEKLAALVKETEEEKRKLQGEMLGKVSSLEDEITRLQEERNQLLGHGKIMEEKVEELELRLQDALANNSRALEADIHNQVLERTEKPENDEAIAEREDSAIIEELRSEKTKLEEKMELFTKFIEKQRVTIENLEESNTEKASVGSQERTKLLLEREKRLELLMKTTLDRQAEVTAHAYFAKKALKKMGTGISNPNTAVDQSSLISSAQQKRETGWGILSGIFGGSSEYDLDKEGGEIIKETLAEEVAFEHDIVFPQKELARARQSWSAKVNGG